MGRELKRVPLDFDWPLNFIWKGYWMPYTAQKCPKCDSSGSGPLYKALSDAWYGFSERRPKDNVEAQAIFDDNHKWQYTLSQEEVNNLCDEGRLSDYCREFREPTEVELVELQKDNENTDLDLKRPRWIRKKHKDGTDYYPTAELVNRVAPKSLLGGHDSVNHWIATEFRARKLGIPEEEWKCKFCDGEGEIWFSREIKQKADDWYEKERYEPPKGEGYQLWETVSEGSPISPVFASAEEMIDHLVAGGANPESAKRFVEETAWAFSLTMKTTDGKVTIKEDIDTI